MEFCVMVVQFAVGLTAYSVQCFETPAQRQLYVRELSSKPRSILNSEGILIRYVMRGDELTDAWESATKGKSLIP